MAGAFEPPAARGSARLLGPRFHELAPGSRPTYVTSALLDAARLTHAFGTRHFPGLTPRIDDGPFAPAAAPALRRAGFDGVAPAFARQVHGATVIEASAGGRCGEADALVTSRAGQPLAIFTADCVPLVLCDPVGQRVAAVHAGWRGTAAGVARVALEALVARGARPADVLVALGPAIGPCCYEIDAPVVDRLAATFPSRAPGWLAPRGPGKWLLDLWRANRDQLVDAGVPAEGIDVLGLCTYCRPELFYSYRRGEHGPGARLVTLVAPARQGGAPVLTSGRA